MLETGYLLDSRYRIEENIGNGGMGEVYRVIDTRLNVPVAVKLLAPGIEESAKAFEREAQLLSNLRHPALPLVTDYSQTEEFQYLVMEYIEGDDLQKQLVKRDNVPFAAADVLNWAKQLIDVMNYLHGQGIQHRDVKPSNIKVRNGRIFLLDFGIAYGQIGEMPTMNSRSFFWESGTKDFASLEQMNGEKTTPASDIYSLAATLYLLLTGKKPESANYRFQVTAMGNNPDPLKDIRTHIPSLDGPVAEAVMSALNLDMNRRPQSIAEFYWKMFPPAAAKPKRRPAAVFAVFAALPLLLIVGIIIGVLQNGTRTTPSPGSAARDAMSNTKIDLVEESKQRADEAMVLLQSGKYKESIKKSEEALNLDPENAFARFILGDAVWDTSYDDAESFQEMSRVQEQADKILAGVTSPKTAEEYTARGWANLAREKYDIAISDATKALEIKSGFVAALMIRASARTFIPDENNKSLLKAFDDFEEILRLMPNYAQAWANRASAYVKLDKNEWAISDLTEAIRILPSARFYNGRGGAYYNLGKYPEARSEYQQAQSLDKNSLAAKTGIGDTYFMEEDWRRAIENYSKVISIKPTAVTLRSRGFAYGALKEFGKAVTDFDSVVELDKSDPLAYQYRGQAYCGLEQWKKAIADFSKAIDLTSSKDTANLSELYKTRAYAYREIDDEAKARSDEKRATTLSK
jgi:serine/threonine protein kinase/regulator of sirC expression with transglutaminase-like and TPR domain